jgi:hypothetical protein
MRGAGGRYIVSAERLWVVLVVVAGCATARPAQQAGGEKQRALTSVLGAERELTSDLRAQGLRALARSEYEGGKRALEKKDVARARELFDRATVDADLSVALVRQETFSRQAEERSAQLERLRGQPPSDQAPVAPQTGEAP